MKNPQMSLPRHNGVVIAATSDLHGLLDGIKQVCNDNSVDVLVLDGDIQPAEIIYHCNDTACGQWFRNQFFRLVRKLHCEVVAIPGNHDFWLRSLLAGEFGTLDECRKKYMIPSNFHLLCDSEVTVCGLRFYGTPWVPWISGHWCYETQEASLATKWEEIPDGVDVLVAHTPPLLKDCNIDASMERDPMALRHFGSPSLWDAISQKHPFLVFCGHIHSGDHKPVVRYFKNATHGTFVYNVSRVNERYYIGYPIRVLRITEKVLEERIEDSSANQ